MTNRNKTRAHQAIERELRRVKVIELYQQGLSQVEVARELDCSVGTVNKDLHDLRVDAQTHSRRETQQYIDQQLADIEAIRTALLPKVKKGSEKAATTLVVALNRQAKLLGIDGPDKHEVAGPNSGPISWKEAVEQADFTDADAD